MQTDKKSSAEAFERTALLIKLRASSPLRPAHAQRDAGHLPLFVAANEPGLL